MKMSAQGLKDLQDWENKAGRPATVAYLDDAGVWTIGTGHTKGVKRGDTSTPVQNAQWLCEDVQEREDAINRNVHVQLTQSEFDALAIWVFNVGVGEFLKSTALKRLNLGDYEGCSIWMQKYVWIHVTDPKTGKRVAVKDNGLVNRQAKTAALWSQDFVQTDNGSATPSPLPTSIAQTATGKLQIGAITAKIGAAISAGIGMAGQVLTPTKQAQEAVAGFSGYWVVGAGVLLACAILFSIAVLVKTGQNIQGITPPGE